MCSLLAVFGVVCVCGVYYTVIVLYASCVLQAVIFSVHCDGVGYTEVALYASCVLAALFVSVRCGGVGGSGGVGYTVLHVRYYPSYRSENVVPTAVRPDGTWPCCC